MSPMTRKLLYLCCMPIIFVTDLILAFAGVPVNYFLFPLLIVIAIVRLSDRGVLARSISDTLKVRMEPLFPDVFETGVMPTERFLLVTVPMLIAAFLNIKIFQYVNMG